MAGDPVGDRASHAACRRSQKLLNERIAVLEMSLDNIAMAVATPKISTQASKTKSVVYG